jgi:hypothetical protein
MMIPRLIDYLNQSILVSIPVLHSDVKCRSYTLMGLELQGLWLQSEELLQDLLDNEQGEDAPAPTPAFVSFSHIAFVVLSAPVRKVAGFPASLRSAASLPQQAHTPLARSPSANARAPARTKIPRPHTRERRGK